jgi:hypothetical protein
MTGYRAWLPDTYWGDRDYPARLRSVCWPGGWPPGPNQAICKMSARLPSFHPKRQVPDKDCECGYWSMSDFKQVQEYFEHQLEYIYGTVQVWGRVIEHKHGNRSEFAQVAGLYDSPGTMSELVHQLALVYDVPVLSRTR